MRFSRLALSIATAGAALALATSMAPSAFASDSPQKLQQVPGTTATSGTGGTGAIPYITASGGHITSSKYYRICPNDGSCGNMYDYFYTTTTGQYCIDACLEIQYHVTNGEADTEWLGSSPYNANKIAVSTSVWVGGVGVSVGASGVTGSVTNITNGKAFSYSVNNNWEVSTSFNSIYFTTALEMSGPYENETGTADFGSQQFNDVIS